MPRDLQPLDNVKRKNALSFSPQSIFGAECALRTAHRLCPFDIIIIPQKGENVKGFRDFFLRQVAQDFARKMLQCWLLCTKSRCGGRLQRGNKKRGGRGAPAYCFSTYLNHCLLRAW